MEKNFCEFKIGDIVNLKFSGKNYKGIVVGCAPKGVNVIFSRNVNAPCVFTFLKDEIQKTGEYSEEMAHVLRYLITESEGV